MKRVSYFDSHRVARLMRREGVKDFDDLDEEEKKEAIVNIFDHKNEGRSMTIYFHDFLGTPDKETIVATKHDRNIAETFMRRYKKVSY